MVKSVLKMGLLAVALVAGMSAVRAGSALDTLVMPGANVLLSYDLKAVQSTAIYKKFAAMAEAKYSQCPTRRLNRKSSTGSTPGVGCMLSV